MNRFRRGLRASRNAGLLGNERALGEAFHITADEGFTWDQIYQGIGRAIGQGIVKVSGLAV